MHTLSVFVKESLPNYLHGLPVPDSFKGWFSLGIKDWLRLIPVTLAVGGIGFGAYAMFDVQFRESLLSCPYLCKRRINTDIKPDADKVVDIIDIEDVGVKSVYCRCWKSKKFPYCDGSHNDHNKNTGDNVGPLIVKKAS